MHVFSNRPALLERCAAALLLIGAGAFIAVYVGIAIIRLQYPFELEWMEGGSVVHVQRVLDGLRLYDRPSLEFTPFIYTPFYYYVSAVPARLFGNGFFPLRLVSFAASLGSMLVIWLMVHRRTQSASAAFLASALFAAIFKLTGAWFDLARVDSLALFLALAAAYLLDGSARPLYAVAAAILLFLAFFTKQSFALVGASLAAAVLITGRGRERLLMPAVLGALAVVSVLVLNASSNGWFRYYVFDVPAGHPLERAFITGFWTHDLGAHLPVALVFAVGVIAAEIGADVRTTIRDVALLGGLVLSSYLSRIHSGGFDNVLMPAAAGIAIFFGIGWSSARKASQDRPWVGVAIAVAAGMQFAMLVYSPTYFTPTTAARLEGEELLSRLASIEGDVYIPEHPWYAALAGKTPRAQTMALADVMRARGSEDISDTFALGMRIAVEREQYAAFVVDSDNFLLRPSNFERHYRLADARLSGDEFLPTTGMHRAPRLLFIRRSASR